MTYDEMTQRLQKVFTAPSDQIRLNDDAGDDRHFSLMVISARFKDKSRLEKSQMVHAVLKDLLDTEAIHALTLKLKTPDEFSHTH